MCVFTINSLVYHFWQMQPFLWTNKRFYRFHVPLFSGPFSRNMESIKTFKFKIAILDIALWARLI